MLAEIKKEKFANRMFRGKPELLTNNLTTLPDWQKNLILGKKEGKIR